MHKSLFLSFFLFFGTFSYAQDMLFCFTNFEEMTGENSWLGYYDIETCTDNIEIGQYPESFLGLTYHPLDIVFGAGEDFDGIGGTFDIFRINVSQLYFSEDYTGSDSIQTIACDYNGTLYTAGKMLTAYDYFAEEYTVLGELPIGMEAQGDMTFRDGNLYLTTESNTIIQVDTENPMNSTEFMIIPEGVRPITGLTTYPYRCDSIVTYAVQRLDTTSILYILDFDSQTFTEICDINWPVRSIASPIECKIPPCEMYVDLDADDDSGATELNFQTSSFCTPPIAISDSDVEVFSALPIDSIQIELTGILNPGQEYLELLMATNISISGSGTTTITLINNGTASFEDFEAAIEAILFYNNATVIIPGQREVVFQVFSAIYFSEFSTSFVALQNNLTVEVIDESPSCFGDNDGSLSINPSGGLLPYSIFWEDGTSDNPRENLNAGSYTLNLFDNSGCELTETIFLEEPELLTTSIQAIADTICGETGSLTALPEGGTQPYAYNWSNGPNTPENNNIGPGDYMVEVTDSNGCMAMATITLFAYDTIFVNQAETLCEGETFEFDGQSFSTDTTYCAFYNSLTGCDSVHCITLEFLDTVLVEETQQLCFGESLVIDGTTLDSDTTTCFVYTGQNGCDSTYCISLTISGGSNTFEENICTGESYTFEGMILTETGIYSDTLQNQEGCDSILILNLTVRPEPIIELNTIGSLCSGDEVEITTGVFANYVWSTGSDGSSILIQNPGNYSLTATDDFGCEGEESIEITEEGITEVLFSTSNPSCFGESDGIINIAEVVGGTGPFAYSIDGQTFQQMPQFGNLTEGSYSIQIEDADGCIFQIEAQLETPSPIELDLGESQTVSLGDSIQLEFTSNFLPTKIEWSSSESLSCDTCLNPILNPTTSTSVVLTLMDENGCVIADEVFITVDRNIGIYIPNAFSPNKDGINDVFSIYTNNSVSKIIAFRIFNRWGDLLHEVNDVSPNDSELPWNGAFKGQEVTQGVYIYSLEVERLDGVLEVLGGDFVLIR